MAFLRDVRYLMLELSASLHEMHCKQVLTQELIVCRRTWGHDEN